MNADQLKELANVMVAVADGAEWECYWEDDGWAHPAGRDLEYCIANGIPIRIKPETHSPADADGGSIHPQLVSSPNGVVSPVGGLSKRDWFAGMAMQGYNANRDQCANMTHEQAAANAYRDADAMLAARKEGA